MPLHAAMDESEQCRQISWREKNVSHSMSKPSWRTPTAIGIDSSRQSLTVRYDRSLLPPHRRVVISRLEVVEER